MKRTLMLGFLAGSLLAGDVAWAGDTTPPGEQAALLPSPKTQRRAPLDSHVNGEAKATPDPTFLLAVHNVEPWFTPPGKASDLLWERSELKSPPITKRADK